jgi:hypothetical protein
MLEVVDERLSQTFSFARFIRTLRNEVDLYPD